LVETHSSEAIQNSILPPCAYYYRQRAFLAISVALYLRDSGSYRKCSKFVKMLFLMLFQTFSIPIATKMRHKPLHLCSLATGAEVQGCYEAFIISNNCVQIPTYSTAPSRQS
jgi:hypothetical protein